MLTQPGGQHLETWARYDVFYQLKIAVRLSGQGRLQTDKTFLSFTSYYRIGHPWPKSLIIE